MQRFKGIENPTWGEHVYYEHHDPAHNVNRFDTKRLKPLLFFRGELKGQLLRHMDMDSFQFRRFLRGRKVIEQRSSN